MKLYNSIGPNPHIVRMFAAELGVDLELVEVDLRAGDNRKNDHLARNPAGQLPALEIDGGEFIAEVTAICEYLDEGVEGFTLLGKSAAERAQTRMWTRRVDLAICEPMLNGFRFAEGLGIFEERMITLPDAAPGLKRIAQDRLAWLDEQMSDGREFIGGTTMSMADIHLFCMLAFAGQVGQPLDQNLKSVSAWFDRMAARPSASA